MFIFVGVVVVFVKDGGCIFKFIGDDLCYVFVLIGYNCYCFFVVEIFDNDIYDFGIKIDEYKSIEYVIDVNSENWC